MCLYVYQCLVSDGRRLCNTEGRTDGTHRKHGQAAFGDITTAAFLSFRSIIIHRVLVLVFDIIFKIAV